MPSSTQKIETHVPTDDNLRMRVRRFLATRGIQGFEGVRIDVEGDSVVLSGRVASNHDRWLCNTCSRRVTGVLRVIDELEIATS